MSVTGKKAERAILESENRFRLLFNTGNDAVFVHPLREGAFFEVNKVACKWLGYSREELLELSPGDILKPQSVHNWPQAVVELTAAAKSVFEVDLSAAPEPASPPGFAADSLPPDRAVASSLSPGTSPAENGSGELCSRHGKQKRTAAPNPGSWPISAMNCEPR